MEFNLIKKYYLAQRILKFALTYKSKSIKLITVQKENDVFKRKSREASKTMSIILYTFLK